MAVENVASRINLLFLLFKKATDVSISYKGSYSHKGEVPKAGVAH